MTRKHDVRGVPGRYDMSRRSGAKRDHAEVRSYLPPLVDRGRRGRLPPYVGALVRSATTPRILLTSIGDALPTTSPTRSTDQCRILAHLITPLCTSRLSGLFAWGREVISVEVASISVSKYSIGFDVIGTATMSPLFLARSGLEITIQGCPPCSSWPTDSLKSAQKIAPGISSGPIIASQPQGRRFRQPGQAAGSGCVLSLFERRCIICVCISGFFNGKLRGEL